MLGLHGPAVPGRPDLELPHQPVIDIPDDQLAHRLSSVMK
jgi:hypothetical protein